MERIELVAGPGLETNQKLTSFEMLLKSTEIIYWLP
jgi:hypothetical protein